MQRIVILKGSDTALLLAAVFALDIWEFEKPMAQQVVPTGHEIDVQTLHDIVRAAWVKCRRRSGGSRPSPLTRELVEEWARLDCEFNFSPQQLELAKLALKACELEFRDNEIDFYVALPGNLDWYGLTTKDLLKLADRLSSEAQLLAT